MREEDRERIERGDPESPVEIAIGLGLAIGVLLLAVWIVAIIAIGAGVDL